MDSLYPDSVVERDVERPTFAVASLLFLSAQILIGTIANRYIGYLVGLGGSVYMTSLLLNLPALLFVVPYFIMRRSRKITVQIQGLLVVISLIGILAILLTNASVLSIFVVILNVGARSYSLFSFYLELRNVRRNRHLYILWMIAMMDISVAWRTPLSTLIFWNVFVNVYIALSISVLLIITGAVFLFNTIVSEPPVWRENRRRNYPLAVLLVPVVSMSTILMNYSALTGIVGYSSISVLLFVPLVIVAVFLLVRQGVSDYWYLIAAFMVLLVALPSFGLVVNYSDPVVYYIAQFMLVYILTSGSDNDVLIISILGFILTVILQFVRAIGLPSLDRATGIRGIFLFYSGILLGAGAVAYVMKRPLDLSWSP